MSALDNHWVRLSDYRLRSADVLHESGQHLDAVFNFQQSIEYMLKALIAESGKIPPRTHTYEEVMRIGKSTQELLQWLKQELN